MRSLPYSKKTGQSRVHPAEPDPLLYFFLHPLD